MHPLVFSPNNQEIADTGITIIFHEINYSRFESQKKKSFRIGQLQCNFRGVSGEGDTGVRPNGSELQGRTTGSEGANGGLTPCGHLRPSSRREYRLYQFSYLFSPAMRMKEKERQKTKKTRKKVLRCLIQQPILSPGPQSPHTTCLGYSGDILSLGP